MRRKTASKKHNTNPAWRAERIETTPSLFRLIGPLEKQKGRKKTICVAIGSGSRVMRLAEILNEADAQV